MKNNILIFFILSFLLIGNNLSAQTDSDGDGIINSIDLDDDNDGILDTVENGVCGIPNPNIAPGNGVLTRILFNENFGTMNTSNGTTSINLAGLGTGATTTYNYYQAIAGTTPTEWTNGDGPPHSLYDGRYTVFNNIQQTALWAGDDWQTIGDHTNGGTTPTGGRMLIVNSTYDPSSTGEFYRRTLSNVVQGSPINASLWAMNITVKDGRINPNITVRFEQPTGNVVYSFDTGDISKNSQGDVNAWKFFKNPTPFFPPTSEPIDVVFVNNAPGGIGNDLAIDDIIIYQSLCDTDNDGTPNYLDLDSDNDGCLDAIEGDENVLNSQLVNAASGLSVGTGSTAANQNLCTSSTCVDSQGVPIVVNSGGTADIGSDQGQGVGSSANAAINSCICYNDPNIASTGIATKHGITLLNRAGADNGNWPMLRNSAHTVLESNTKGFVITRLPTADFVNITNPVDGMMVYDTTAKCLKIYTVDDVTPANSAWSCFSTPTCP